MYRGIEDDDLDRVEDIIIESLPRDLWRSQYDLHELLQHKRVYGYVAEAPQGIVGFAIVRHPGRYGQAELLLCCVAADHRRRGGGRELLLEAVSELPVRVHRLYADVREDLLDAQLWLKACGFVATQVIGGNVYRFVADIE